MHPDEIWNQAQKSADKLMLIKETFEPEFGPLSFQQLLFIEEDLCRKGLTIKKKSVDI